MSRIQQTFERLHGRTALVSYITCGDPNLATTLQLMQTLVASGTDIIELGVPFSDPMADGPVIQAATERALRNHVSLADVLQVVAQFRQENQTTPVVLMGYLNPVYHMGYERFAQAAAQAGVDGVLTVDCPAEAIDDLYVQLQKNGLDCIFLIAPTTTDERIKLIGSRASGFVYYVSLKGVTGSSQLDTAEVSRKIDHLRQFIQVPVGVGFGIRDADSARRIGAIADAVIVGSRFVQTIAEHAGREAEALAPVVAELRQALE
ncbi:tryptophan synthase subunit alpha [Snodgrassella alvi]|uniref:tryptophan synthase subunit alpha n=1 Tax=Snodgrassella alvi TaxID=1196083 RepID=UPI000C1E800D|nr:tryptophan synthase subunit alpha [Snodgrassella alvi]PIT14084.1 tryptophan synthase subunit alpha [Snodgrassella alvi]PIT16100.1 tryptophan synthase subunit alpha [Snodgrassella alvi]